MRAWIEVLALFLATPSWAATPEVSAIVDKHIIPGYETLATQTIALASKALADCTPTSKS